jgi:hypothetical protein
MSQPIGMKTCPAQNTNSHTPSRQPVLANVPKMRDTRRLARKGGFLVLRIPQRESEPCSSL